MTQPGNIRPPSRAASKPLLPRQRLKARPCSTDRQASAPQAGSLSTQLIRAREILLQKLRPHLNAHGLTDQQWRILRTLAEAGPLEIGDLGDRCCIHPASLSRMLPRLDTQGLTERQANAEDKRRIVISITAEGRAMFDGIAPGSEAIHAEITRRLGAKRLQDIHRLLDEMIQALADGSGGGRA